MVESVVQVGELLVLVLMQGRAEVTCVWQGCGEGALGGAGCRAALCMEVPARASRLSGVRC